MLTIQFFTFNPFQENTYLLYDEDGNAVLIDPGCYGELEENKLIQFIEENNLAVKWLVNTHCHIDHVFGNKKMAEQLGLQLYIHPNEAQVLSLASQAGTAYGVPFDNYAGPVHFLQEGDVLTVGSDELEVLLAPGHSPGSICFYCKKQAFTIAGDVLFKESVGRTDLPGGNHQALINSIKHQLFVLPNEVKVYPGHGPMTTIGHEKEFNPFLQQ